MKKKREPKPKPQVVYEFFGVVSGDPVGHMRAWADEGTAWRYGNVMGMQAKKYRIIEIGKAEEPQERKIR